MTIGAVLMIGTANAQTVAANAQTDSVSLVNHETTIPQARKRVGVVLSGGGAKGMAHIGVLKVLERAGIPVDIVTGTSMGSIIGGLYAIGYNANALDSMVRVQNWETLISDRENLRYQSLSDRKKRYTYLFTTEKASGKGNRSAGGLIQGKHLSELFQRVCTGYTDSLDFSKDLPIPFACVATDIMTNTEVVFHKGRLPQAMRASMAIPAAFSPVRIGNMVLVDGGMRNNYPADVARDMGADIVNGVTLSGKPKTADEITGAMSVIGQIIDVNCINKYDENIAITDLHMNVDPHSFGTVSFTPEAIDSLIRYGEEEAMRHWDQIVALKQRIGIDDSFRPTILQPLHPKVLTEKQKVTEFVFENMTPQAEKFIRQKFHLQKMDSIDMQLEQTLTTSMRVDLFYQTAECRLVPDGDGVRAVFSAGNRKSMQLLAGVRYDTEEYAAVQVGLNIPLKTAVPVNTDVTLRLGKRLMARAELTVHPRFFTRPTLSCTFRRNDVDVYLNGDRSYNILYNQFQGELIPFNHDFRHFNIQIGLRWDYLHYRSALGAETARQVALENEHFFSYRARIAYNSEDNWNFPTRGARINAEYVYLTNNFAKLNERAADGTVLGKKPGMSDVSADWRMSFTIGSRFTIQPMFYGRLLFGAIVPPVFGNTVGGDWFGHYIEQQMPFAGIGHLESIDRQFVAAQLQAQLHIGKNSYVLLRGVGGQRSEHVKNLLDSKTLLGGQIAYYYNTMFGPLGASLGYSNRTKEPYFYLNLGYEL
jgi:NTE family protein